MPPGSDFGAALVNGLNLLAADQAVEVPAQTEVFLNTTRLRRRIKEIYCNGSPRILPRLRLISELADDLFLTDLPLPVSALRRRLELTQLILQLLEADQTLAPRSTAFDLADSLARLMAEMQSEGVNPGQLQKLDVADQSGHWQRSLAFFNLVQEFFNNERFPPDTDARQRLVIEAKVASWQSDPPDHPVIVAGSTGSRGSTSYFMQAVSKLQNGAIVLPGFDFEMTDAAWRALDTKKSGDSNLEGHPQYRFKQLLDALDLHPSDVALWPTASAPSPSRNKLISLSLRPAPVTDQWRHEGPSIGNLLPITSDITLLEAENPRAEAEAIALRLREVADEGITAALITPDRMLTRQVAASLDRWNIVPDDSAGTPLSLSAPGRLLRQVADMLGRTVSAERLLALLKHPLVHTGSADRGPHLRYTRELELLIRKRGIPFPSADDLSHFAQAKDDQEAKQWIAWLTPLLAAIEDQKTVSLALLLSSHINICEKLCAGTDGHQSGGLWEQQAGAEALQAITKLEEAADAAGDLSPRDYAALFSGVLADGTVRDRDIGHPNILIWGTLEARVQGADLVILGGMNEGVWPETPAPDPWLNRQMRRRVGLLLPERQIGLSAHDYQQAVAAKEVWITRSKRSADSETVPSRWINRLSNLLSGLAAQDGPAALAQMQERGQIYLKRATQLSLPTTTTPKAPRPSPQPPVASRPKSLSVTQIKTLIRDPYSIYARHVLALHPVEPLLIEASAPLKGIIFHKILERFANAQIDPSHSDATTQLLQIASEELRANCAWPAIRLQWQSSFEQIAPAFLEAEAARRENAEIALIEGQGESDIPALDFVLTCKADRMDRAMDGTIHIYDYKTGQIPSKPQQLIFDKQLLLEAAMVEAGAFHAIGKASVGSAKFIAISLSEEDKPAPLEAAPPNTVWANFIKLIDRWSKIDRGYTARIAHFKTNDVGTYDHLSRFGEWDDATAATAERII